MGIKHDRLELLKLARGVLESRKAAISPGICSALEAARSSTVFHPGHYRFRAACSYLQRYVSDSLGDHAYLSSWLMYNRNISGREILADPEKLKRTRLAWIDWMIKQYEEQLK